MPAAVAEDDVGGWGAQPRVRKTFEHGAPPGFGSWKNGQHVVGARNTRMEKEMYGEVGDGLHQVSRNSSFFDAGS